MIDRRGIGRTEVIVGVAVLAVLILVTVPLWMSTSRKAARAEVPVIVDSIRTAEMTQKKAFEEYVSAASSPRPFTAVDETRVPWKPSPGFEKLNWNPPEGYRELYGSYQVVATPSGFTVTGVCDVDGDGKRARFEATEAHGAQMVTEDSVY